MPKFKFEVVQTTDGLPDPGSYPERLSHTPCYSGAAKVVVQEFSDEKTAKLQVTIDESGTSQCESRDVSEVWLKHCPPKCQSSTSSGMDVFYIGPAEESDEISWGFGERHQQEQALSVSS